MKTKHMNKVRHMKGVLVGRGTAGRANANGSKKLKERSKPVGASGYFSDVAHACNAWLRKRGMKTGGFREMMIGDIMEKKEVAR